MERVLFTISSSEVGGAQKWLYDQIALLSDSIEIHVASANVGWLADVVRDFPDVNFQVIPGLDKYIVPSTLFSLRNLVISHQINCIVASSASAGLYARLLKAFSRVKVVYVSHGWSALYNFGRWSWLGARLEQILSYFTDAVICVSKSDVELARKSIRISANKLVQISNGVFKPKKLYRHDDDKTFRFLTVSRLEHPKRLDLAINATLSTNYELTIVGGGAQIDKLRALACNSEQIKFVGEVKGFKDFSKYDAFILISDSEGLPISAVEAMSFGLPLILSRVGGCPELIANNGFLVSNSKEEISSAMNEVVANHRTLSRNSEIMFLNNFCLERKKQEYLDVYVSK